MADKIRLGIIGCGQMARAILGGILEHEDLLKDVVLFDVDPGRIEELSRMTPLALAAQSAGDLAGRADVILIAVKPFQVKPVMREIAPFITQDQVVISVAAGISLESMTAEVGEGVQIVRVMPNVPALVGKGALAVSFSEAVGETGKSQVADIFQNLGLVEVVPETYMNAVTALSGSGPAFVFLFAEALTDAAVNIGLPRDLARRLTNQTILGSAAMMMETGEHPALLRERVTSPGGTTIAGLKELESGGVRNAVYEAVLAAFKRAGGK